jgi:DNA-binding CsgD family transcriptional regulator
MRTTSKAAKPGNVRALYFADQRGVIRLRLPTENLEPGQALRALAAVFNLAGGDTVTILLDGDHPLKTEILARTSEITALFEIAFSAGVGSRLTPQLRRVFDLVVSCRTNKEIANAIGISERTVKFHVGRLFKILGCTSRQEIIAKYRSQYGAGAAALPVEPEGGKE